VLKTKSHLLIPQPQLLLLLLDLGDGLSGVEVVLLDDLLKLSNGEVGLG
jgi:hypothetical protein